MAGLVSTLSTQALIALSETEGVDRERLLEGLALDASLDDPNGRVPFSHVVPIWERSSALCEAPVGLRAASKLPFGAYRVIDFLCWSSPTVGDGVTKLARYMPLLNDAVEMVVRDQGDPIEVALGSSIEIPTSYAAFVFAAMLVRQRLVHIEPLGVSAIRFRGPAPSDISEYETTLDCAVSFEAQEHRLEFTREQWNRRLNPSDPSLYATLTDHADRLLSVRKRGDVSQRAAAAILAELEGGDASLERVSKRLAMSERSLQRHLKDAGTSFAAILEAQRAKAARRYLERGDFSVHEVGHLLGFSGPNSFTRAFKRWTGMTPGQYREQHRA